ncbi:MAG: hypothetical protein N2319_11210 [Candidatus Kapabacteria bacterium]|nr:hypothetical protein [Candidatus Kapabacteria bacterium]
MANSVINKHLFLLILFFAVFYQVSSALRTNIDIFDSLSKRITEEFIKSSAFSEFDTVNLIFKGKDDFLVKKHILNHFNNLNIVTFENEQSGSQNQLEIVIEELKTTIKNTDDKDNFIREIFLKYTFFQKVNGVIKNPLEFTENYQDTIRKTDINQINSENHSFAKAELPQEKPTVFEQIIEPLIIVSAAVLTVILLFTIRSN